jgi:lipopolysaccharide/colanic/teichoic acid biosynthesis glycosyltransferase
MRVDTQVITENQPIAGLFRDHPQNPRSTRRAIRGTIPRWKRSLDVTCIVLTLPIWLPVMLLTMCFIKLVSPGPVFFRQERIGYKGRRFMILKFRSMKVDAETKSHEGHLDNLIKSDRPMTKLDACGDPRLIPFGTVLRASGLDELPQIFNVLFGDMSLVGPRPCTPHEFRQYEVWQRERVNAQPGLTGYWQVNGKNRTTFTEMIAMDIYYCCYMSLWLDLWIIVKTVPAIAVQLLETRAARRASAKASAPVYSSPSPSAEG